MSDVCDSRWQAYNLCVIRQETTRIVSTERALNLNDGPKHNKFLAKRHYRNKSFTSTVHASISKLVLVLAC